MHNIKKGNHFLKSNSIKNLHHMTDKQCILLVNRGDLKALFESS